MIETGYAYIRPKDLRLMKDDILLYMECRDYKSKRLPGKMMHDSS